MKKNGCVVYVDDDTDEEFQVNLRGIAILLKEDIYVQDIEKTSPTEDDYTLEQCKELIQCTHKLNQINKEGNTREILEICASVNTLLKRKVGYLHQEMLGCYENQGLRTLWITAVTDDNRLLVLPIYEDANPSHPWIVEYEGKVELDKESLDSATNACGSIIVDLFNAIDSNTLSPNWTWGGKVKISNNSLKKMKHVQSEYFRVDYTNPKWLLHKDVKKRKEHMDFAAQVDLRQDSSTDVLIQLLITKFGDLGHQMTTGFREVNTQLHSQRNIVDTLLQNTHDFPTLMVLLPDEPKTSFSRLNPSRIVNKKARLHFICSYTLQLVPCGAKKKGYKVSVTKEWVKKASPYLHVGMMMLCISLASIGIPVGLSDIQLTNDKEEQSLYLESAFDILKSEGENLHKSIDELKDDKNKKHNVLSEMLKGEKSREAYSFMKRFLEEEDPYMQYTGLVKCTSKSGKTAWVKDEEAVKISYQEMDGDKLPSNNI